MKLIDANNFSNEFNSTIYNKLQNDYLNSTADDKTKDVADFVVTDIMTTFNDLIDNAPTVEERPQGEWIVKQERAGAFVGDRAVYSYTCPFCKVKEFAKYPFCHCGADMRGEEE